MSRAPIKPLAKKASEAKPPIYPVDPALQAAMDRVATAAGVPKPAPRKRSPKRAVAVKAGVADAAPVKLRGTTRKAMVKAHRELHEAIAQTERPSMETWEETHFPYDEPDYAAENARNRRPAADTWITIATVFGVIVIIGLMAWWVG